MTGITSVQASSSASWCGSIDTRGGLIDRLSDWSQAPKRAVLPVPAAPVKMQEKRIKSLVEASDAALPVECDSW